MGVEDMYRRGKADGGEYEESTFNASEDVDVVAVEVEVVRGQESTRYVEGKIAAGKVQDMYRV